MEQQREVPPSNSLFTIHVTKTQILTIIGAVLSFPVLGSAALDYINPRGTSAAVEMQTEVLSEALADIRVELQRARLDAERNTRDIQDLELRLLRRIDSSTDSLIDLMRTGLGNLDGYFRGRIDQLDR
jgi:hypothetical protein